MDGNDSYPPRTKLASSRRGLLIMLVMVLVVSMNFDASTTEVLARVLVSSSSQMGEIEGEQNHTQQDEAFMERELDLILTEVRLEDFKKELEEQQRLFNISTADALQNMTRTKEQLKEREKKLLQQEAAVDNEKSSKTSNNEGSFDDHVAGCVMIMDGNHELIEWLAYHYHTLPLRRLIILNDPKSRTTPEPIIQRWRGKMEISLWNDTMVFPNGPHFRYANKGFQYVQRQEIFNANCLRHLYNERRHRWVQIFDPDEYATINERLYDKDDPLYGMGTPKGLAPIIVPSKKEPNSTLTFVKRVIAHVHKFGTYDNRYLKPFETPCIGYNRKQYKPREEEDSRTAMTGDFLPQAIVQKLSTYRWRHWEESKQIGKAFLDLSRIEQHDIGKGANVHMPLKNRYICRPRVAWGKEEDMALIMNHYAQSLDQALFRSGDSRGGVAGRIDRYEKDRKEKRGGSTHEPNAKILEWLAGFIESVGKEEAERLLRHAGRPYKASIGAYFDPTQEVTEEEGMKLQQQLLADAKAAKESEAKAKEEEAKIAQEVNEEAKGPKEAVSVAEEAVEANKAKVAMAVPEAGANSTCSAGIPKLIHFVYLSPHLPVEQPALPDRVTKVVEQWREMNPSWEIKLWNNALVREHYPDLAHLMSNVTTMAWVADMVRYHIMQQFGGVYLDTDFIPFQPLDGLCKSGLKNFIVCQDPHYGPDTVPDGGHIMLKKGNCRNAINAVMGFEPNHPAVTEALNVSLKNTKWALSQNSHARFRLKYTGPWVWTAATKKDPTVSVLHPYTFLPCTFTNKKDCIESKFRNDHRIFAMHAWEKSW